MRILLAFTVVMVTALTVSAQSDDRVMHHFHNSDQSAALLDLIIDGQTLEFDKVFRANGDWLKEVSWRVANYSGKVIVGLEMRLYIDEFGEADEDLSCTFRGKVEGGRADRTTDAGNELEEEDIITASISEAEYAKLRKCVEPAGDITSVQTPTLAIEKIYYADGSVWENRKVKTAN